MERNETLNANGLPGPAPAGRPIEDSLRLKPRRESLEKANSHSG